MKAHLPAIIFYSAFFLGQFLFIIKRGFSAVRSKINPAKNIWQFLITNWYIFLIRSLIEAAIVYTLYKNFTLVGILHFFHVDINMTWVSANPITSGAVGYMIDSLFDAASQSSYVPDVVKKFVAEIVPSSSDIRTQLNEAMVQKAEEIKVKADEIKEVAKTKDTVIDESKKD